MRPVSEAITHELSTASESDAHCLEKLLPFIEQAAAMQDVDTVQSLMEGLHAADIAELINQLSEKERARLTEMLSERFDATILPELSSEAAEDVIGALGTDKCAEALALLESDDALHLISELTEQGQAELLGAVPKALRGEIEQALSYPEDSAGRLMTRKLVAVPDFWTVGHVIDYLRAHRDLPENFYLVYVVDARFKPIGRAPLGKIMQSQRDVAISAIMLKESYQVTTDLDQEEVAHLFTKYALVETPVVNAEGRLMGTITVDDVVHVIHEEEGEDYLRAGGVSSQDMQSGLLETMKLRFPWLFINLLTAVLASVVIGAYSETIEQVIALAVLMPIVASMGGNAGTQSVTVAVRALAMKQLKGRKIWGAMRKELLVGTLNGVLLALMMAAGCYLLYRDALLAFTFAAATILTLMIAGFSGAAIPIVLSKLKIDPAVASGVFLTTVTDVVGFLSFLGFAAVVLTQS